MIINAEILERFGACDLAKAKFNRQFPDGLDISRLWGTYEERNELWHAVLENIFLRKFVGWAIDVGLVPARISANLSSADLRSANLSNANLSCADLRSANLSSADLRSADLRSANLSSANLSSANLRSANLSSADLSSANLSSAIICNHTIGLTAEQIAEFGCVKIDD